MTDIVAVSPEPSRGQGGVRGLYSIQQGNAAQRAIVLG